MLESLREGRPLRCGATRTRTLAIFVAILGLGPHAFAQQEPEVAADGDPRLAHLRAVASHLASNDEAERRGAYGELTTLEYDMLPAVRARIAELRRQRPTRFRAYQIFTEIRRIAGSQRADDDADLAPAALALLARDRNPRLIAMVEPLLLWRALEHMRSFDAGLAMIPLLRMDGDIWEWEARRVVRRMGNDIMAVTIAMRNDPHPEVRDWARQSMRRLGADDPGRAVHGLTHQQLADVLRAYAMLHMQGAMPVIVSYVDSEQRSVRRAARWALGQYEGNAIWVLRTEYRNQTGRPAPQSWGFRRVSQELYTHADRVRLAPVHRAYAEGIAARDRGDFRAMRARFDDVLVRAPEGEHPEEMAAGYATYGNAELEARHLAPADQAFRRALRLAPQHAQASHWRAQLAFLEAEQSFASGVFDAEAYRRVVTLDPDHEAAQDVLSSAEASGPLAPSSRRSALGAAALFALLALGLLWRGRRKDPRAAEATPENGFAESEITLADQTLPG